MCALILEYGIVTVSWYAEFALRRRVSMSAIGSVIVMADWPFLTAVSECGLSQSLPPCGVAPGECTNRTYGVVVGTAVPHGTAVP